MKIPFLYRCILYFVISMLISPYYDGWSSTAKYLISEGVFSKYCCNTIECSKLYSLKPICDEQAFNVGKLLSFYRISEFLSSIFIGLFMDNFGPKITIIAAIVLRVLSWILIPSFPNTTSVIIIACILCGIASNGIAFPVFTIAQYTKRFYNGSMILISISLCFGTFYTFILNHIKAVLPYYKPIYVVLVKLVLTHLPLLVLSFFIFPNSLAKDVKLNLSEENVTKSKNSIPSTDNLSFSKSSASDEQMYNKYLSDLKIKSIDVEMNSKDSLVYKRVTESKDDVKSDGNTEDVPSDSNRDDGLMFTGNTHTVSDSTVHKAASGHRVGRPETFTSSLAVVNSISDSEANVFRDIETLAHDSKFPKADPDSKWVFKEFLAILRRVDILVISFASMVCVISLTFAQESFPISYGNDSVALLVNEVLIPISFIFSLSSVFLLDRFGSVPIIVGLNVMCAILHLTMMFTNRILSFFTSILMSLGYSLFMTQYYLYLDKQVPLAYQGSIKGFLVTSIGLILFVNIGLNYLSKTYFYTREIHLALMIVRLLVTVPLLLFLKRSRRKSISQDINL